MPAMPRKVSERQVQQASLAVKRMLAKALREWIEANELTPIEAAERLRMGRARVSHIQNGQLARISVNALMEYVWRTGAEIKVTFRNG